MDDFGSTLAEEFLADLEGDDDDEEEENLEGEEKIKKDLMEIDEAFSGKAKKQKEDRDVSQDTTVKDVATVIYSEKLSNLLKNLQECLNNPLPEVYGSIEDHPEYKIIFDSNSITVDIKNEILSVHKFIRDVYFYKFPELENLILNPLDYIKTVQMIGNKTEITGLDLGSILPPSTVMVVSLTASSTTGKQLSDSDFKRVSDACEVGLQLEEARLKIDHFIESRMTFIAPNLSIIVGTAIAAKLIGLAGGLSNLSRIPSGNVKILGSQKNTLQGFGSKHNIPHVGIIYDCELIQNAPPSLRTKVLRLVSGKCTLAARVDSVHDSDTSKGKVGQEFREFIETKIEKFQELPPAKAVKPLVAPDDKPRPRRGGKRARKMKEKYAMTEIRKQANRLEFGPNSQDEYRGTGKGLGMMGKSTGKVTMASVDTGSTKAKRKLTASTPNSARSYGSLGTQTSGLSSSLAFTPVQGIELENPNAASMDSVSDKYFSSSGSFSQINPKI